MPQLTIAGIEIEVTYKPIKHIHLRVHRTDGRVSVSAPRHTPHTQIVQFVEQKRDWIERHRQSLLPHPEPDQPVTIGSTVALWGQAYQLICTPEQRSPIVWQAQTCSLNTPDTTKIAHILHHAYLEATKATIPPLLSKWQAHMGVTVQRVFVQRMKSRWGSCTYRRGYIRLNSELAKYPTYCLEYVVVHELTHLLEPSHNARFYALQELFLPEYHYAKSHLDTLPPLSNPAHEQ